MRFFFAKKKRSNLQTNLMNAIAARRLLICWHHGQELLALLSLMHDCSTCRAFSTHMSTNSDSCSSAWWPSVWARIMVLDTAASYAGYLYEALSASFAPSHGLVQGQSLGLCP